MLQPAVCPYTRQNVLIIKWKQHGPSNLKQWQYLLAPVSVLGFLHHRILSTGHLSCLCLYELLESSLKLSFIVAFASIFRTDPFPMSLVLHAHRLNLLNCSRSYLMNSYLHPSTSAIGIAFYCSFLTTLAFTFFTNHILLLSWISCCTIIEIL